MLVWINGVCKMAKKKNIEPARINLTLTPEQNRKLSNYLVNVVKKQGEVPKNLQTKLLRWAFDEWVEKHGEDYDIDWSARD